MVLEGGGIVVTKALSPPVMVARELYASTEDTVNEVKIALARTSIRVRCTVHVGTACG